MTAEVRTLITVLTLFSCTALAAAPLATTPPPRFSGGGALIAPVAKSADERFDLDAQLQANRTQRGEGFVLQARLQPAAKAAAAFCGVQGDAIFSNGFEGA